MANLATHWFVPQQPPESDNQQRRFGNLYSLNDIKNYPSVNYENGFTIEVETAFSQHQENQKELCVLSYIKEESVPEGGHIKIHAHGDYHQFDCLQNMPYPIVDRRTIDYLRENPRRYEVRVNLFQLDRVWGTDAKPAKRRRKKEAGQQIIQASQPRFPIGFQLAPSPERGVIVESFEQLIKRNINLESVLLDDSFVFQIPSRGEVESGFEDDGMSNNGLIQPTPGYYILCSRQINQEEVSFDYDTLRLIRRRNDEGNFEDYFDNDYIVLKIRNGVFDGYVEPHLLNGETTLDYANRLFGHENISLENLNARELRELVTQLISRRLQDVNETPPKSGVPPPPGGGPPLIGRGGMHVAQQGPVPLVEGGLAPDGGPAGPVLLDD